MAARGFRFVCPAADTDLLRVGATATLADVRGRR
jgi:hypothetical protein